MVVRKNLRKKFALISVYDKKNIKYICQNLTNYNYEFISTGETSRIIKKAGYKCTEISDFTKFKEMFDGRIKSINAKIYGSILFKRNNLEHQKHFKKLRIPIIDLVIVNLYPFKKYLKSHENEAIDMIDVGGAGLLRAAGKNFNFVTVIPDTSYYKSLINNIIENNGDTSLDFRKAMAKNTFKYLSDYDKNIYQWFKKNNTKEITKLKYGENPGQESYITNKIGKKISDYQINGKEISYNNIIDIDSGLNCIKEFSEPTCVIIKHTNPCGVGSGKDIYTAFIKAYNCDVNSAFGGIIVLNKKVNLKLAAKIINNFFEIVVATDYSKEALNILVKKKRLIVLKIKNIDLNFEQNRSTIFGQLYQKIDRSKIDRKFLRLISSKKASQKAIDDLVFSLKVVKHLKSNAIVVAKNKQTLGIGVGQTNRYKSLKIALDNIKDINFVCASDGFFPFIDGLKLLKKKNCVAVVQPFGSINDNKLIDFSNKYDLALYCSKKRLFKH